LSLSRLNHRLPGGEMHSEVVQGTTYFHHEIADTLLPQGAPVFDDAATLDPTVDRLDPQPTLGQRLVGPWLLPRVLLATGLLDQPEARPLRERARQAASSLAPPAPGGPGIGWRIGPALLLDTAAGGVAPPEEQEAGLAEQDLGDGLGLVLAALTRGRLRRVWGAHAPPLRPGPGTRGDTGGTPLRPGRQGAGRGRAAGGHAASRAGQRTCSQRGALLWPMPPRRPGPPWRAEVVR